METKFKIWAMVEEFHTDPTDFSVTTMDIHESNTFVGEHDTLEGATDEINKMGCGDYINSHKATLNKSQRVLAFIKANNPKTRKEIVTFICEQLNGKAYQEGYWSVQLGVLMDRGYFKKQDGKYVVTPRGEVYLMNSVLANKLPRVGRLERDIKRLKDIIVKRDVVGDYVTKDAMTNAVNLKQQRIQYLESEVFSLEDKLESSKNDCGHYERIQTLEHQLSTSQNNEMLLEKEVANVVKSNKELNLYRDTKRDELEEALTNLTAKYDALNSDYQEELEEIEELKKKLALGNLNIKELENERGEIGYIIQLLEREESQEFLSATPPPSGEYGDFSKAQYISIIKQMIS